MAKGILDKFWIPLFKSNDFQFSTGMMQKFRRLGVTPEKYLSQNLPRESPLNKLYTVPTAFLDSVIVHFITLTF